MAVQPNSDLGAYRLIERIGVGGMGEVWLAAHVTLGRRAAIKLLRSELSSRPDVVARFFNEARAAAAIRDPGIVQIFDVGEHDGNAFIVMELLEGEPLDARLRREGALPVDTAARLVRQVATSLAAAHARGIVHRDLKPENIFVTPDAEVLGGERAKVLDFGIAKLASTVGTTQTATIMGTPTYMSPEQCRGAGHVDHRSDIYSLGCVLFHLVTGRPPFQADGAGELISMHLREIAPRAASLAPHVAPVLDDAIARCLAKDPDQRFSSMTALASTLADVQAAATSPSFIQRASASANGQPTTLSSVAMEVPAARSRSRWFVAGTVAIAIGAIPVFLALRGGRDTVGTKGVPLDTPPPPAAPVATASVLGEALSNLTAWTPVLGSWQLPAELATKLRDTSPIKSRSPLPRHGSAAAVDSDIPNQR